MKMDWEKLSRGLEELKSGNMVILTDDSDRENEGDLVIAAEFASAEKINFMAKEARGIICLSLTSHYTQKLGIDLQPVRNSSTTSAAFTASIDAANGISTGVSAADRAKTIAEVLKPDAGPHDIMTPGHIFPLLAKPNGVLERQGHTEGSIDLMKMAGLQHAAVICEIMNSDGSMARQNDLEVFSKEHNIPILSINDIVSYRLAHEINLSHCAESLLPTKEYGDLIVQTFQSTISQETVIVLHAKDKVNFENPLIRVHSSCFTGDVLGSLRCDCGAQLQQALKQIVANHGLLIYLQQEGRGIGLLNKMKAYALQDSGLDTVEANEALGFHADQRNYQLAAQVLHYWNIKQIRLLTNNPKKIAALTNLGIQVSERLPLEVGHAKENARYLMTKKHKLGHNLTF